MALAIKAAAMVTPLIIRCLSIRWLNLVGALFYIAEPAMPVRVGIEGLFEMLFPEVRPKHIGHVQLGIGQLPQ